MEELNIEESWNKKRIIIAVLLVVALITGGYFLRIQVLGEKTSEPAKSVQGTTTENEEATEADIKGDVQKVIEEKITNLREEVSKLNIVEVASSSPQVQKIINDIKSLEQYPENQIKEICKKVCGL